MDLEQPVVFGAFSTREAGLSMSSSVSWFLDEEWSVLELKGRDRKDFLLRLTTNVLPQNESDLVHTFLLSVNAKVLSEFWVGVGEQELILLVPQAQIEQARTTIDLFHFTEDIELRSPDLDTLVLLGDPPSQLLSLSHRHWSPDPRFGPGTHLVLYETDRLTEVLAILEEQGAPKSSANMEQLRIATGTPRFGTDYDPETLFLEMAQTTDFSETKGCYPGQEIVARVLHRGKLRRWLRAFRSESQIPSGWSCQQDGKEVARVTSSVSVPGGGSQGYLYVRREVGSVGTLLKGSVEGGDLLTLEVRSRPGELEQHEDDKLCATT